MAFTISSRAFSNNGIIPAKYTCDGEQIHPPLTLGGIPDRTRSIVIVMDDPDIPPFIKENLAIEAFDHVVCYNIPPEFTEIEEGMNMGQMGLNSKHKQGYTPPCPPDGEHRYVWRALALSDTLTFEKTPTLREVERAAEPYILETAVLIGRYTRTQKMHM